MIGGGTGSRRGVGRAVLAAAALAALACGPPRPERVVLISVDTLRADHVGAYGAARAHTPTLDGLAGGGVRFATAVAPTPITLPSHSTLLTGLTPLRHGVRNNSTFRLPEDVPTLAEQMRGAGFATAAFVGAVVLDRAYGLDRGFDVYDDAMEGRFAAGAHGYAERRATEVVDAALAWLDEAPPRFFVWVHLYDPHANYDPPPGFVAALPGDLYAGEIAYADAELGRLLAAVEARHGRERTLVVATSDHGESLGEHGELTHSLTLYDATQRVPLLMRGPGLPAGQVVETPVGLVDVAPTVLAQVGIPPPPGLDGRDLGPLIEGAPWEARPIYIETLATQVDFGWSPLLGLRGARYKWLRAPRPELYDLAADPGETRNLAPDPPPEAARVRDALDGALDAGLAAAREPARAEAPDAARRRELEALGYVVGDAHGTPELGVVGGVDPKDGLATVHTLMQALQLISWDRPEEARAMLEPLEGGGHAVETHRAEAARLAGDARAAERHARAAVAFDPRVPDSHVALGEALEAQGRLDEAARAYAEARRLGPGLAAPQLGLARVAEARGDRDEALRLYREAAHERSGSTEARWREAALRLEAGEAQAARALLAALPGDALRRPDAALRLARAEAAAGDRGAARARLEAALEDRPGSRRLRDALAELDGS